MKFQLRVRVPTEKVAHGVTWLEVVPGDGGFYLLQYEAEDQPPKWDSFYLDLEEVLADCETAWGIDRNAWERSE